MPPLLASFPAQDETVAATDGTPGANARTAVLPACLPRLRALLAECDGDGIALWRAHQREFSGALSVQVVAQIDAALEHIDFDKALALLPAASQPDTTNQQA